MKTFILVFSCLISFVAFWYGLKLVKLYLKVKSWQKTNVTIISKAVVLKQLSSSSRARFKIQAEYSYKFNAETFKNNKVFLVDLLKGEKGFLQSAAEKFVSKMPNEIEAYVNPQNPQESVLYCDGIVLYTVVLLMSPFSLLIGLANYMN